jgi:hypothetical protein
MINQLYSKFLFITTWDKAAITPSKKEENL